MTGAQPSRLQPRAIQFTLRAFRLSNGDQNERFNCAKRAVEVSPLEDAFRICAALPARVSYSSLKCRYSSLGWLLNYCSIAPAS